MAPYWTQVVTLVIASQGYTDKKQVSPWYMSRSMTRTTSRNMKIANHADVVRRYLYLMSSGRNSERFVGIFKIFRIFAEVNIFKKWKFISIIQPDNHLFKMITFWIFQVIELLCSKNKQVKILKFQKISIFFWNFRFFAFFGNWCNFDDFSEN